MKTTITVDPSKASDWDLILYICHWSYTPKLPRHITNKAYAAAWAYTDAYGEQGYVPPQGYDWSGFRDSSEESKKNSANAIRKFLGKWNIKTFEVTENKL